MERLTISEARDDFAETVNRVAYRGERIVLHRREKDIVAIIPMEDLSFLEELEDKLDIEAAREALAESDERVSYNEARKELISHVRNSADQSRAPRPGRAPKKRVQARRR